MSLPPTRAVVGALETEGGQGSARFVGGCVRDTLLQRFRPEADIDIATTLTPSQVCNALAQAGLKWVPTGIEHGTVTAIASGRAFEVTTLRRDLQTDGRRAVVAFSTDWAQDAARRDFRFNALYLESDGALYDPTGEGVADALAGRVVFVGDPATRIREDYLRVLRFFRFYAAYGREAPDKAALRACAELKQGVASLSGERASKEMFKLLEAPEPAPSVRLMAQTGVLSVLLQSAIDLRRFEGLMALEQEAVLEPNPVLRLAALLVDDEDGLARSIRRLKLSRALGERLSAASAPDTSAHADMSEPELRMLIYRIGGRAALDRLALAWASVRASAPLTDPAQRSWAHRLSLAQSWTPPRFPITGADIKSAGVPEGPEVGTVRRSLEQGWMQGDFAMDRADLLLALARTVKTVEPAGDPKSPGRGE